MDRGQGANLAWMLGLHPYFSKDFLDFLMTTERVTGRGYRIALSAEDHNTTEANYKKSDGETTLSQIVLSITSLKVSHRSLIMKPATSCHTKFHLQKEVSGLGKFLEFSHGAFLVLHLSHEFLLPPYIYIFYLLCIHTFESLGSVRFYNQKVLFSFFKCF